MEESRVVPRSMKGYLMNVSFGIESQTKILLGLILSEMKDPLLCSF